jgi:hypothetical protein
VEVGFAEVGDFVNLRKRICDAMLNYLGDTIPTSVSGRPMLRAGRAHDYMGK